MKKIFLAKIFFTVFALSFASFAWSQQSEAEYIQAAINAAGAAWTAGDTSVGELTPEERSIRLGFIDQPPPGPLTPLPPIATGTPGTELDWRNNNGNYVTGVRDQRNCGSCWAFGSVGGLESRTLINNHTPGVDLDLSEQVVLSCSHYGNCAQGGYLVDSYFVTTGVPLESCYPYTATDGACGNACANWQSTAYKIDRFTWVVPYGTQQTVDALKYAVTTYGPSVVTLAVYNDFFWYSSGIYTHVTGYLVGYHAVLLVGYDDTNGCFIAKNSWGPGWGESGFFRIAYSEVLGACHFGYETLSYGAPFSNPSSTITFPASGSTVFGTISVTGTASLGVRKVEVGITPSGGQTTWYQATGTSPWSYGWTPPATGDYNIKTRATDLSGNIESPGSGINVTVAVGLAVDKDTVDITYTAGAPAATSTINLSSIGVINYTAESDSPWLTVSPESELTPKTLTLSIFPDTHTPGFISGHLTISSPSAVNSPLVVTVNVVIAPLGSPELPHFDWNTKMQDAECATCHQGSPMFLPLDERKEKSFCRSCHNTAGIAHERNSLGGRNHPTMVNVTSGGNKFPTYGNITTAEYNNQPFSQLGAGDKVICATCHNPMSKSEDYGRVWEMTITDDRLTYRLEKGGWSKYGGLKPLVYRDSSLWGAGGPVCSNTKKLYLVDPAEYSYDEDAGSITFKEAQDPSVYIYVTVDFPYLRASCQDNRLCLDCHSQATHGQEDCLNCHMEHNTSNIEGIKDKVRTPEHNDKQVKFLRYTGASSFADGDTVYDGICEVCHTTTRYYRRDGTGFANHSGGFNYDGKDCAACHSHASGFARYGITPGSMYLQIISPLPGANVNGDVTIEVYAELTNGAPIMQPIQVSIDSGAWHDCTFSATTGFWQYVWTTNPSELNVQHEILAQGISGPFTGTAGPISVTVNNPDITPPVATVTSPSDGSYINSAGFNIAGSSSDTESGVNRVEVSTDDGSNWTQAAGTTSWSYAWTTPSDGPYTIKARAVDNAGNLSDPGNGTTVTVDKTPPAVSVYQLTYSRNTFYSPDTALRIKKGTTLTWYVAASDSIALKTTGGVTVTYNNATPPTSDITSSLSGGYYIYTVTLPSDRNTDCSFTFTATDKAGNVTNSPEYIVTTY